MRLCRTLATGLLLAGLWIVTAAAPAAAGEALKVSDREGLMQALAAAKGGETILLEAGQYGGFYINGKSGFDPKFPAMVTLASVDRNDPAVFDDMDLRGVANLTMDGLVFDFTFDPERKGRKRPFIISRARNVTIRNSVFDGDTSENGFAAAIGFTARASRKVTFENNEVRTFARGIAAGSGFDMVIRGNEVHNLRMDGLVFSQMRGITIENNYIHDFIRPKKSSDHADMIQFWTNGTDAPSTDIVIRNNVLNSGAGGNTHSIFMRNDLVDRGKAGREMFYRNVTIEQNVIVNGHTHGISLGEVEGAAIRHNTLIRNQTAAEGKDRNRQVKMPRIKIAQPSVDVRVEANIGAKFQPPEKGWTMQGNMPIQDLSPTKPGYYHAVFANALEGDPRDLDNFTYLPDTGNCPGDGMQAVTGAALLCPAANRDRYRPGE